MPHVHDVGAMDLKEMSGKGSAYLPEGHVGQERRLRCQMHLEIFIASLYESDVVTLYAKET